MTMLHDLIFVDFDRNKATLKSKSNPNQRIQVQKKVLDEAFITRAWLDQTIINSALGKCLLSAEVEGNEVKKIWLNIEADQSSMKKGDFKHFGLELNKPARAQKSAFDDMTSLEKVADKLGKRFKTIENERKEKIRGDLVGFAFDNDFIEKLNQKQEKNADALSPKGVLKSEFTPDWRVVTGMGEASVYETNMALHHTYGIPYIPASTIKGVLQHYLKEEKEEEKKATKEQIRAIFGENDEKTNSIAHGQVIFFDAFPTKAPRIELDVMTPHYPKYYSEGLPPADWQSPTPITFLTVGRGTSFRFLIGLGSLSSDVVSKKQLEEWLESALTKRGLGAKTAVGYGYMNPV